MLGGHVGHTSCRTCPTLSWSQPIQPRHPQPRHDHPRTFHTSPISSAVEYRILNVRTWEAGDDAGLDAAWVDEVVVDLGSQWGQYEYVTNIGFAA
ncbi:hypothetical protein STTU_p0014 (plasmid) [Streptomyces sp. Tu6071]|nr:hypothetical protein STTU_p0014 [Streptomyces sp. Tu6071]